MSEKEMKSLKRFNPVSLNNLDQTSHGMCHTPTYNSWLAMIRRCKVSGEKSKWYADRGIGVCFRWKKFENFYADMGIRPDGMSLDRVNNEHGYEPDNCRWTTKIQQAGNKRTNVWIEYQGLRLYVAQWAEKLGIHRVTISQRLRWGWPVEKVLSQKQFHEQKGRKAA